MKSKFLVIAVLGILAGAFFFSCQLNTGTSIEDQISSFMKDVNAGNYSNLYTHLHPTETVYYDSWKPASAWSDPGMFPSGETYTLGAVLPVVDVVSTKISSSSGRYSDTNIIFNMALDGEDYKIKSITIAGVPKVFSRVP